MVEAILSLDPAALAIGGVFVAAVVIALLLYAVTVGRLGAQSTYKRRLATVSGRFRGRAVDRGGREGARRRQMQEKLKEMEEGQRAKKPRRHQIRHDIQQAGLKITVRQFLIGSAGLAVFGLAVPMLLGYHVVAGILIAIALGMGLPKLVLSFLTKRRKKQFIRQFPDAIDVIVRGIKSGLPVGECLAIIGRESPEPIAPIFQDIVDNIKLGLNLEECLNRATETLPVQELRFFAIVLQIQQQTGGNLAETLTNLSTVLRDRKKMRDKVAAMASEANTSAMIIGSLPFLITLALTLVNPGYISILFDTDTGKILIVIGLTWMSIGVIVMRQMISFDI